VAGPFSEAIDLRGIGKGANMAPVDEAPKFRADAHWCHARRGDLAVVLIDTRGPEDHSAGHLNGARHFDPFRFHHSDTGEGGLNEVRGQLAWIFSMLGIAGSETVVFYEAESGMRATRAAWPLEYMGHSSVRVLDGGLRALRAAELVTTAARVTPVKARLLGRMGREDLPMEKPERRRMRAAGGA